jgi:hypothetical protein
MFLGNLGKILLLVLPSRRTSRTCGQRLYEHVVVRSLSTKSLDWGGRARPKSALLVGDIHFGSNVLLHLSLTTPSARSGYMCHE